MTIAATVSLEIRERFQLLSSLNARYSFLETAHAKAEEEGRYKHANTLYGQMAEIENYLDNLSLPALRRLEADRLM